MCLNVTSENANHLCSTVLLRLCGRRLSRRCRIVHRSNCMQKLSPKHRRSTRNESAPYESAPFYLSSFGLTNTLVHAFPQLCGHTLVDAVRTACRQPFTIVPTIEQGRALSPSPPR